MNKHLLRLCGNCGYPFDCHSRDSSALCHGETGDAMEHKYVNYIEKGANDDECHGNQKSSERSK